MWSMLSSLRTPQSLCSFYFHGLAVSMCQYFSVLFFKHFRYFKITFYIIFNFFIHIFITHTPRPQEWLSQKKKAENPGAIQPMRFWMSRSPSLTPDSWRTAGFQSVWKAWRSWIQHGKWPCQWEWRQARSKASFFHVLLFGLPPVSVVKMKVHVTLLKKDSLIFSVGTTYQS